MADLSVEVSKVINAPLERVYSAWTDPDKVKQWHSPWDMTVTDTAGDARPGGTYSITMQASDGSIHQAAGEYKTVEPLKKLVMTWGWQEGGSGGPVTQLTVWFHALSDHQTEVKLLHEHFESREALESHKAGWDSTLAKLDQLVGDGKAGI